MKNKLKKSSVKYQQLCEEFEIDEHCFITETSNDKDDPDVSISKARVLAGETTLWHQLINTAERYLIIKGTAKVELDYGEPIEVGSGDVVRIPPGIPQRITNTGTEDLIFYCICTPQFKTENYVNLE